MNKRLMIFPVLFAGGAVAFGLRLAQNLTGFEADTGLPVPGNLPGLVLPLFLGIDGIMYAGPVADLLAALIAALMLRRQMGKMKENIAGKKDFDGKD